MSKVKVLYVKVLEEWNGNIRKEVIRHVTPCVFPVPVFSHAFRRCLFVRPYMVAARYLFRSAAAFVLLSSFCALSL